MGRCGLNGKQPALSIGPGYGLRVALHDNNVGERSWGLASLQHRRVNELMT